MSQKKTVWFEVEENETIDQCLERIAASGYMIAGKKEEPVFQEVDGEIIPIRQMIRFKGLLIKE